MESTKNNQSDKSSSPTLRERAQEEIDAIILNDEASIVYWGTLAALAFETIKDEKVQQALDRLRQGQLTEMEFAEDTEIVNSYAREFLIDRTVERYISGDSNKLALIHRERYRHEIVGLIPQMRDLLLGLLGDFPSLSLRQYEDGVRVLAEESNLPPPAFKLVAIGARELIYRLYDQIDANRVILCSHLAPFAREPHVAMSEQDVARFVAEWDLVDLLISGEITQLAFDYSRYDLNRSRPTDTVKSREVAPSPSQLTSPSVQQLIDAYRSLSKEDRDRYISDLDEGFRSLQEE